MSQLIISKSYNSISVPEIKKILYIKKEIYLDQIKLKNRIILISELPRLKDVASYRLGR